jgi:hypothetical protein
MSETPDAQATAERIDILARHLASRTARTNFTSTATLIVGILLLAVLAAWFYFGYQNIKLITDPHRLVDLGKEKLYGNLHQIRLEAADEIRKSSPQWAVEISNGFVEQAPEARRFLETQFKALLDEKLVEAKQMTSERFRRILAANREEFRAALVDMTEQSSPKEFVDRIAPIIEQELGADLRYNSIEILGTIAHLNHQLERLAKGENLNEVEQKERLVLGLIRHLQMREGPETIPMRPSTDAPAETTTSSMEPQTD